MKIRALIESAGKTAAGMHIPPEVVEALGAGKKPPVRVTINGYTYRSSIGTVDGRFMVGVSVENRAKAGVDAGQEVEVDLELDTDPREVTVPPDLQAALDRYPAAAKFFESLSYSNRLRHVRPIADARTPETRQRNIEKSIAALREGRA
jgi:Bacteriocin-protection, YdeI or OmpD-Associated/Domain of unknown function (DUF1905)